MAVRHFAPGHLRTRLRPGSGQGLLSRRPRVPGARGFTHGTARCAGCSWDCPGRRRRSRSSPAFPTMPSGSLKGVVLGCDDVDRRRRRLQTRASRCRRSSRRRGAATPPSTIRMATVRVAVGAARVACRVLGAGLTCRDRMPAQRAATSSLPFRAAPERLPVALQSLRRSQLPTPLDRHHRLQLGRLDGPDRAQLARL